MQRDDDSANNHNHKKKNDKQTDSQPELLTDHRKNEIGVRVRQIEHFLPAVSEPETFHSAATPGDQRLHLLKARVIFVALKIGERDQPLHAGVGRADKNDAGSNDREQAKED